MDARYDNSVEGRPPDPTGRVSPTNGLAPAQGLSGNSSVDGSVSKISSDMVAPLLGTIYGSSNLEDPGVQNQGVNYYRPPKNLTLESTGKRCVVLIQPLDHTGRDLIYDPILTNELIYDSADIFSNRYPVQDLRINKIKGIITVQYSFDVPWDFLLGLTSRDHLGEYPVKMYIPNSDLYSYGTISPVSLRLSNEKICQWLEADAVKIVKVERLKKRKLDSNEWVDSETIKITFGSNRIPQGVKLCGSFYKTRHFIPFPVQCWKCQRLGHMTSSCKSKIRCRKCTGNHDKKECTSTVMKCSNCSGPHNANSRDCPVIQKAYNLEKERVLNKNEKRNNNIAQQASPQITDNTKWPSLQNKMKPVEKPQVGALYSHAVAGPPSKEAMKNKCSCSCKKSSGPAGWPDREFFEKLKNFVLEFLSVVSTGESSTVRSLLASSAIRNHFGIDLTKGFETEGDTFSGESDPCRKRPLVSPDGVANENVVDEKTVSDNPEEDSFSTSRESEWKSPKRKRKKANKSRREFTNKKELLTRVDFLKKK